MLTKEDRELILKFTRKVTKLEKRVADLEVARGGDPKPFESIPKKVEVKSETPDETKISTAPPKQTGTPHCVVTSTFNLEGANVNPMEIVMTQNEAQTEIRQYVIDFCKKHKIIGMTINFKEQ